MSKVKRVLSVILSIIFILSSIPVFAIGAKSEDGYLTYTVSNGEATITGCDTSISGAYTIPDTLGGYPVTSIVSSAFYNCTSLTSIVIPDSVTSIGGSAFYNCTSLKSATIGSGVTSIGRTAFFCCTSLESVTLGNSVTTIGDWAFHECTALKSVIIPDSVTSIGDLAFYNCIQLTSVTIPDGVTSIGYAAFSGCISLTGITVDENNEYYLNDEYGVLFNKDKTELMQFPVGSSLTSYSIPDSVTSINGYAFYGHIIYKCTSLKHITIGNSVTSIGRNAFLGCAALESIIIPDSVTSIGDGAFYGCASLTSITLPDGITSIGSDAFDNTGYYNDSSNWEDGVLYIDSYLIAAKASISGSCEIKDGTKTLAYDAFYYCTSLTSVTIPDSVTVIDGWQFYHCTSLASITIPDSVTTIDRDAFYDTAYYNDDSNWDNGVLYIGNHLIEANEDIVGGIYEIKEGTKTISSKAFYDCSSLISVTIPDSVTLIGVSAFSIHIIICGHTGTAGEAYANDNGITFVDHYLSEEEKTILFLTYEIVDGGAVIKDCHTSVSGDYTLPDTIDGYPVTSIGDYAFGYCKSLTSITIPDGVTSIGSDAFRSCTSLTSIEIPDSVTSIGNYAFEYCSSLERITIPNSVTSIGSNAFYNTAYYNNDSNWEDGVLYISNHLIAAQTSISGSYEIKEGTKTIAYHVFYEHTSLENITIPDSVVSIDSEIFYGCTSLESVTIGSGVTSIGNDAFYGCMSLEKVTIGGGLTSIGSGAFSDCTSLKTINIPDSVTSIGSFTFCNCASLESIAIPDGVETIGWFVFYGCTSLKNVSLGSGLTLIDQQAFDGCSSLTSITIPGSVTTIGSYAFGYAYNSGHVLVDGFTIYGYTGTAAETYANNHGITFISLGDYTTPEEPTTEEPTTTEPTTDEPTTEELTTEEATTDEPTTVESTTEEPTTAEPTITEPNTEEPTTEEPTTAEPTTDEPTTAEPTTAEPTTAEPTTAEPTTDEPTTAEPTTEDPTTAEPTTAEPTTTELTTEAAAFTVSDEAVTIDEENKQITISSGTSAEDFAAIVTGGGFKLFNTNGEEIEGESLVGTGCKVQTLDESGNVVSEYTVIVLSDVDGNGKITAADARLALRAAAQLDTLEGVYLIAADYDADTAVKPADARMILRVAAKLE